MPAGRTGQMAEEPKITGQDVRASVSSEAEKKWYSRLLALSRSSSRCRGGVLTLFYVFFGVHDRVVGLDELQMTPFLLIFVRDCFYFGFFCHILYQVELFHDGTTHINTLPSCSEALTNAFGEHDFK